MPHRIILSWYTGRRRVGCRGGDWAGPQPAQATPRCTKCNSPPINGQCTITVLLYNGPLLCGFNVSLKGQGKKFMSRRWRWKEERWSMRWTEVNFSSLPFTIMRLDRTYQTHQFIFSSFLLHLLFIPCDRLNWLSVSFLLHVKHNILSPLTCSGAGGGCKALHVVGAVRHESDQHSVTGRSHAERRLTAAILADQRIAWQLAVANLSRNTTTAWRLLAQLYHWAL